MRRIGFLVLAAALGIAAIAYAFAPFTLTRSAANPPMLQLAERAACSAPIRQVVDPPTPKLGESVDAAIRDWQPLCKDAGRTRLLTSAALLVAAALAALLAFSVRRRSDQDSEPSPAVSSSSSGST